MSPFRKHGFLGNEAAEWCQSHRKSYSTLFEKLQDLNSICHDTLFSLQVDPSNTQELVIAALFARCLELYASGFTLLERGLSNPARAVMRVLLEAVMTIRAIAKDRGLLSRYIDQDELQRRKLANKALATTSEPLSAIRETASEELLSEINETIDDRSITRLSTEDLAKRAGLHDWYVTAYSSLSQPVHSSVRDLERHMAVGENGDIEGLRLHPDDTETIFLGATAGQMLSLAVPALTLVFAMELPESIRRIHAELTTMLRGALEGAA